MSENTTNKNVRDDGIDLLDLFRRMGRTLSRWGKTLGRAFLITTVFLIKRWLPLGLSIALGIGVSFLLKTTSRSSYTSDLILRNNNVELVLGKNNVDLELSRNTMSNADMISYLNRLKTYCEEGNLTALANSISISEQKVKNILNISAFWIIDKGDDKIPDFVDYNYNHNIYDTVNVRMQDRLDIRVRINSPQELTAVRNGIISFINRDSLFQQRNRVRLRQNNELLKRLDNDILQLDSLQKVKYFEETRNRIPQSGGQMIFIQEQKTQLVYGDIYSLYSRKQTLESERELYKGIVTVLSDFSIPSKRDNGALYYGKFYIPLFFCITVLILILVANRKKLEEVYKKY
ncbi:MAG: hypothetical protein Q7T72_14620 [Bacteroidales bacterium]|nr:hypothetical protein [Bacteroidales bacterium]